VSNRIESNRIESVARSRRSRRPRRVAEWRDAARVAPSLARRLNPRPRVAVAGVVGVGRARARGLDKTRAMVFISWVYISLNT
jgi:hypothetical protein